MQILFIGFFKDANGDTHRVEQANKKFRENGEAYATGLLYTDNLSVNGRAVFDKLPDSWIKVKSPAM